MAEKFVNYRSFNDKAVAIELYDKLSREGFAVEWESSVGLFDASFANDEFLYMYYVKLRKEDFEKADKLLMKIVGETSERPADDYYLFSFTNKELIDVLKNPHEWNEYDRFWTEKILNERNVGVREEEIKQSVVQRLEELKNPWKMDKIWVLGAIAFYVWDLYFLSLYPGLGGIFLGLYFAFSKKTMPDGERVMAFSPDNRLLGKIVLITGLAITAFILLGVFGVIPVEWYWYTYWAGYY